MFIVLIHVCFDQIFDKFWEGGVRVSSSIGSPGFDTNISAVGSDEVHFFPGVVLELVPGKIHYTS